MATHDSEIFSKNRKAGLHELQVPLSFVTLLEYDSVWSSPWLVPLPTIDITMHHIALESR
jgi:hypothetical protein